MGSGHSKPNPAASPLETITAISPISSAATSLSLSLSRATISSIAPEVTSLLSTSSLSRATTSLVETTLTTSASVAAASPLAGSATELTSSLSREITSTLSEEATSSLSRAITSTLSQVSASPLAASAAAATQEAASATMSAISSASISVASATATALGISGTGVGAGVSSAPLAVISQPAKGPFTPETAFLGTIPTKNLDVPITAVFLVLFAAGAANHFIRHELNSKRGHKFHLSDMIFDFCMVRVVTCTMRIVWAAKPQNNSIVLAALIFENAGVVVLFAVNVVLTQRVVRAIHPNFGWHPVTSLFFLAMLVSVPMIIIWNIVNTVVSFFTLNPKVLDTTHDLLLFGSCWTLYLSIFPLIFLIPATIIPCKTKVEKFGTGHFRVKIIFLVIVSCMLAVGTITRLIGNVEVFPAAKPGKIDSKVIFYVTGFVLEIIVVALYQIFRFDLRFYIPDGSSGPGDYSGKKTLLGDAEKMGEEPNYQDVDVKMRVDIQTTDDGIPERKRATKEQVREAIYNMRIQNEIVGQPIDSGDSELLIYAFRVQKPGAAPQRPARYTAPEDRNSMERSGYDADVKGGLKEASEYGDSGSPSYYNPSIRTGLPRSPRPPPRNNAWKRASRGYWNMRQSLI